MQEGQTAKNLAMETARARANSNMAAMNEQLQSFMLEVTSWGNRIDSRTGSHAQRLRDLEAKLAEAQRQREEDAHQQRLQRIQMAADLR